MVRVRGLTLLETLICIGVILLLAGLLTTVAIRSRASARVSACTTNLEQLGKALRLYTIDYDDYVPPYASWDDTLNHSMPEDAEKRLMACLGRYGAGESVWHCPLGAPGWTGEGHGYAIDEGLYIMPGVTAATLFNDRNGHFAHVPTLSSIAPTMIYLCDPKIWTERPSFISPHGENQANALFFDGHVHITFQDPG